jgi:peptide-methionine (S)-S-oxide reductase
VTLVLAFLLACGGASAGPNPAAPVAADGRTEAAPPVAAGQAEAIFAAGCFWCSESDFEKVPGVISVVSGYTGGRTERPTYREVGTGATGHTEAVRVVYDPARVTYERLLDVFWANVDPFDPDGQFCDQGSQYRPAILAVNGAQKAAAERSRAAIAAILGKPVVVAVEDASVFWVAEAYHQDFHATNPVRYGTYRLGCRRDAALDAIWAVAPGKRPATSSAKD